MVVLKFHSKTCGPCRVVGPMLEELSKEIGFELKSVDIGIDKQLTTEHNVRAVPTVAVIEDGKPPRYHTGAATKEVIKQFIIDGNI